MALFLNLTRRGLAIFIILVLGVVIFLYYIGVLKPVVSGLAWLTIPVQKIAFQTSSRINGFFNTVSDISSLHQQNTDLQNQMDSLLGENAKLKEIARENELLREQLEFTARKEFKLVPAFIIGYDPESLSQLFLIDQGWDSGIESGQPVVSANGLLVGQINEVEKNTSKSQLAVDNNSVINIIIQESRASGLLRGQHGLGLIADTISRKETIKTGDLVVTSGLGGQFPRGLVAGEIEEVNLDDNELFQTAVVKPAIRFDEIEMVFVITEF